MKLPESQLGTSAWRFLWYRMPAFGLGLAALLLVALVAPGPGLGVDAPARPWFVGGIAISVVHQAYVWLAWRGELGWGAITGMLGAHGFHAYRAGFVVLLLSRLVALVAVAALDPGSLFDPNPFGWVAAVVLAVPAAWGAGSAMLFLGPSRASGADHFDPAVQGLPLVDRGAFRYVPNAIYTLVFLGFWAVAALTGSRAAFVYALFNHAVIWLHYACVEKPDMDVIYGRA